MRQRILSSSGYVDNTAYHCYFSSLDMVTIFGECDMGPFDDRPVVFRLCTGVGHNRDNHHANVNNENNSQNPDIGKCGLGQYVWTRDAYLGRLH